MHSHKGKKEILCVAKERKTNALKKWRINYTLDLSVTLRLNRISMGFSFNNLSTSLACSLHKGWSYCDPQMDCRKSISKLSKSVCDDDGFLALHADCSSESTDTAPR